MMHAEISTPLTMDSAVQAALEFAEMGVWGWDKIAQVKLWPDRTKAIFGLPPETEMTRDLFISMLHPLDVARDHEAWAAAMQPDGERVYRSVYRIRRVGDGATRWISSKARIEFDGDRPVRVMGALRDVTTEKETLERLRLSESRLQHAADAGGLTDADFDLVDGRVHLADNFARVMGYRPITPPSGGDIDSGMRFFLDHVAPADRAAVTEDFRKTFDMGQTGRIEYRLIGDDGGVRWIEAVANVELGDDNRPERAFITNLDITSLVAAKHKADEILASIADGFYALDADWGFVYCNAHAEAMLGKRREDLIGRKFLDVFPAVEGSLAHANFKQVMREKLPRHFEFISPVLLRWVAVNAYPTHEGGVSVYFRDISEQKARDEELVAAKSDAERANRAKSKFLAAASHDLRQPVQSLVLLLSLIERQVAANPKAIETARMMKQALGGLNGLLTSILDISRLDAGVIEATMETVDLHMLLGRLAGEYAAKAMDKGLVLRVAPRDLHVHADPGLLERALRNLIENALRNTPRGGVLIGVRRKTDKISGDKVRIDVVDTGVGIPEAKRDEIFDEFIQLNNPSRDLAHGLGLGLAIVARLAALMGAKIEVASRLGRGSRFSLSLPLVPAESQNFDEAPLAQDPGGRVLIVEDNAALRHGLDALTRQWGYQPLTAANGEEGVQVASEADWRFDAIVTDYRLGGPLTGIDMAKDIARRSGRGFPTLILTGDTAKERISEISASGFEVLHKPVDAEHLRRKLAHLLIR
jgi:PAS domain S-box-containing protein